MRLLLGVIGAGLVLAAGAAQAKDPASPAAEKPICKRVYDADTGSHFTSSKRVCHTAAEWKEIEDGTERTMRNSARQWRRQSRRAEQRRPRRRPSITEASWPGASTPAEKLKGKRVMR